MVMGRRLVRDDSQLDASSGDVFTPPLSADRKTPARRRGDTYYVQDGDPEPPPDSDAEVPPELPSDPDASSGGQQDLSAFDRLFTPKAPREKVADASSVREPVVILSEPTSPPESPGEAESILEEAVMTDESQAVAKRRGKPNPHETQIQDAIARHQAGNAEPVRIEFPSDSAAKKGYSNLYQAFRNRGFRASIKVEGSTLFIQVAGTDKPLKKAGRKAGHQGGTTRPTPSARSPGRRGRPRKTTTASPSAGGQILVRVRASKGWTYQEYTTKAEAESFLYNLDSTQSTYEVYERKPIAVKKTIEGW